MQYCQTTLNEHIQKAVYRYRKAHGLSQQAMAEELRVVLRAYSNLERGKNGFSLLPFVSFLFLMLDEPNGEKQIIEFLRKLKTVVEETEEISD